MAVCTYLFKPFQPPPTSNTVLFAGKTPFSTLEKAFSCGEAAFSTGEAQLFIGGTVLSTGNTGLSAEGSVNPVPSGPSMDVGDVLPRPSRSSVLHSSASCRIFAGKLHNAPFPGYNSTLSDRSSTTITRAETRLCGLPSGPERSCGMPGPGHADSVFLHCSIVQK